MKVLVYPNDIAIIGGSQINAIDLAAAVSDAGHEVVMYGIEGILARYIEEKGLRFIPARRLRYRPAPSRIAQLMTIARRERVDLIHAYEWPACLDAYFGAHLVGGVPLLCTVLSMEVPPLIPDSVPLVLGTEELADEARRTRANVSVVEPPIDVDADHPGIDGDGFRRAHGVNDDDILVVTVSRLSIELKLDALVEAIDAVGLLARHHRVRLIIVGDGEARHQLEARAAKVNERIGRQIVVLAGPMMDPRPAYAAADVVAGMGSSAMRALAIGKPVIIQGAGGFSLPFGPENLDTFLWQGFWGVGTGEHHGERLASQLRPLVADRELRERLGGYGRKIVEERFSISRAAGTIEGLYAATVRQKSPRHRRAREAAVIAARALRVEYEAHLPSNKRAGAAEQAARLGAASKQATVN